MPNILRNVLRVVVSIGVIIGLGTCFYSSVQGDWPVALISFGVYSFSLVMLS
jgi:hypothetical protein